MGEILTNGITAFLQVANSNSQIVVMVTKCFSSSYNNKWCVQSYHLLLWFLCHDNYNGSLMLFRFDSPPKKWLILSHYLQCDETPNYHDFLLLYLFHCYHYDIIPIQEQPLSEMVIGYLSILFWTKYLPMWLSHCSIHNHCMRLLHLLDFWSYLVTCSIESLYLIFESRSSRLKEPG